MKIDSMGLDFPVLVDFWMLGLTAKILAGDANEVLGLLQELDSGRIGRVHGYGESTGNDDGG